jgi:hypothetical protein
MVEMGTIHKEGFTGVPLLLGADTAPRRSRRQSHRRTAKRRYPGPTAVLISSTGSSGDAGLPANLMFEIAIAPPP